MARVKGTIQMTGGISGLSFYTMKGSDTVFVRTKGGPSKRRMKVGEEFAEVRKHQSEWAGCVKFSQMVKSACGEVYRLADFNVSPTWNGLGKKIMALDTDHETGERYLQLTRCPEALAGYNLNRNFPFNSVLRSSLQFALDKEKLQLSIEIPRINTVNDIYNVQKLPYFRLIFTLGIVTDIVYHTETHYYNSLSAGKLSGGASRSITTEWFSAQDIIAAQRVEMAFDTYPKADDLTQTTILASAGIEFGTAGLGGTIEAVKNACCGKIVLAK